MYLAIQTQRCESGCYLDGRVDTINRRGGWGECTVLVVYLAQTGMREVMARNGNNPYLVLPKPICHRNEIHRLQYEV